MAVFFPLSNISFQGRTQNTRLVGYCRGPLPFLRIHLLGIDIAPKVQQLAPEKCCLEDYSPSRTLFRGYAKLRSVSWSSSSLVKSMRWKRSPSKIICVVILVGKSEISYFRVKMYTTWKGSMAQLRIAQLVLVNIMAPGPKSPSNLGVACHLLSPRRVIHPLKNPPNTSTKNLSRSKLGNKCIF